MTSESVRLLDTMLESVFSEAFEAVPARQHWDTEEELPAGPGPFGSGLRALGTSGVSIAASGATGPYSEDAEDAEDEDFDEDEWWDSVGEPEPWCAVAGSDDELRDWLIRTMRWNVNDQAFFMLQDDPPRRIVWARTDEERSAVVQQTDAFCRARSEFASRIVQAFPAESSKYFVGGHPAWDRYREDHLSRDEVVGVVGDETVLMIWMSFYRHYG